MGGYNQLCREDGPLEKTRIPLAPNTAGNFEVCKIAGVGRRRFFAYIVEKRNESGKP